MLLFNDDVFPEVLDVPVLALVYILDLWDDLLDVWGVGRLGVGVRLVLRLPVAVVFMLVVINGLVVVVLCVILIKYDCC